MKKFLLIAMLVATGMTENLFAQDNSIYHSIPPKTDLLFDMARFASLRHLFVIRLKNSNSVKIRIANKQGFEKLLNLDSIVISVAKNLALLKDSLQDEMTQKRIDYVNDSGSFVKIRIRQQRSNSTSFVLQADGPALMKIEQDSLNIVGYQSGQMMNPSVTQGAYIRVSYQVSFLINDINKLEELADGTLNKIMQELKEQWDGLDNWSPKKNSSLYAYYNTPESKFITPMKNQRSVKKWSFRPYIQLGLQNVNNILTGSAGVGIELAKRIPASSNRFPLSSSTNRYQLFWEPYFFFDKLPENKFAMRRNDFVTFAVISESTTFFSSESKVEFKGFLSVGYLVHRSGNYFSDNTFKVGLPGASFKFVSLVPEFIFHDLFKNFQPGLKLVLDLD